MAFIGKGINCFLIVECASALSGPAWKIQHFCLIWAKEATRYWKYTWQLWRFPSFPNQVERSCPGAAPRWPSNGLTCLKRSRTAPDSLLAFTQSTLCLVCRSSDALWLIERWKLLAGTDTLLYLGNGGPEVAASDPAPSAHTFVCLINTCVCLAPRSPDTCPPVPRAAVSPVSVSVCISVCVGGW